MRALGVRRGADGTAVDTGRRDSDEELSIKSCVTAHASPVELGRQIVDKAEESSRLAAGEARLQLRRQAPDDVEIKVPAGKLPWNYQQLAGFQMTAAQIEYNKSRSRYVP